MKVKENPGGNRGGSIERESYHDRGKLPPPAEAFQRILCGFVFQWERHSNLFCNQCEESELEI